jgi:hypothetical protein
MQSSTEVQAPGGAAWSRQPAAATNETTLSVSGHILVVDSSLLLHDICLKELILQILCARSRTNTYCLENSVAPYTHAFSVI